MPTVHYVEQLTSGLSCVSIFGYGRIELEKLVKTGRVAAYCMLVTKENTGAANCQTPTPRTQIKM